MPYEDGTLIAQAEELKAAFVELGSVMAAEFAKAMKQMQEVCAKSGPEIRALIRAIEAVSEPEPMKRPPPKLI